MRKQITLILFSVLAISGCTTIGSMRTWTIQETQDWYRKNYLNQTKQPRLFVSPLYYRDSNEKYHYFVSRSVDEWINIKINVDSLIIIDRRPEWKWKYASDSTGSFGYYPVDPLNNFKRVTQTNNWIGIATANKIHLPSRNRFVLFTFNVKTKRLLAKRCGALFSDSVQLTMKKI